MSTPDETKFSIYKPFNAFEYTDFLFRNAPAGATFTATIKKVNRRGEFITQFGTYKKSDERDYLLEDGVNVLSLLLYEDEDTDSWYADEIATVMLAHSDALRVEFAHIAKKKTEGPF